jgi:hypothetical protein
MQEDNPITLPSFIETKGWRCADCLFVPSASRVRHVGAASFPNRCNRSQLADSSPLPGEYDLGIVSHDELDGIIIEAFEAGHIVEWVNVPLGMGPIRSE